MKLLNICTGLLLVNLFNAQVGINTRTPKKMLDINGDFNIRKELRTGGTDTDLGSAGAAGQFFKITTTSSQVTDSWQTLKIANGTGSLSLFYLNTVKDTDGIDFNQNGSTGIYSLNQAIATSAAAGKENWAYIPNANDTFIVTKSDNQSKAILSFQTVAQVTATAAVTAPSASFACGIYVSKDKGAYQLKAVRNDVVSGVSGTYKIYNLNVTLDNLAAGTYVVKAACANRNLGTQAGATTLGIGKTLDTSTLSKDMTQTTLTTSLLQTY